MSILKKLLFNSKATCWRKRSSLLKPDIYFIIQRTIEIQHEEKSLKQTIAIYCMVMPCGCGIVQVFKSDWLYDR